MEKNLFEVGTDIDVEALMSRIRGNAKPSGTELAIVPSAKEREPETLRPLQPQRLNEEIQSGTVFVEAINGIPLKAQGIKGSVEFQVKKFLKWLVHWNTREQAEFNYSVTRSLGLIAHDVQIVEANFTTLEDRLRDIAAQSSEFEQKVNLELEGIRQNMLSELEAAVAVLQGDSVTKELEIRGNALEIQRLIEQVSGFSRMLEESRRTSQAATTAKLAALEQKAGRMIAESAEHQQSDFGAAAATLRGEMNRLLAEQADRLLEVGQSEATIAAQLSKIAAQLSEIDVQFSELEKLPSDVATLDVRLQRLDELGHWAEAMDLATSALETRLNRGMDEMRIRLLRAERALRVVNPPSEISKSIFGKDERTPKEKGQVRKNGDLGKISFESSFDYFLFENKFRGPAAEIKRRQSTYLDVFRGKQDVVDLGCGRGEFLELLSENGINATGIDQDPDMVDFCKDKGLRVVLANVFDYLSDLPEASLDGLSAFQMVEHITVEQIGKLINLCWEKLKPGGVIVAETVNTNCPMALANFYLDPSHVRPVPAEMLRFMFEQRPFKVNSLKFSSPVPGSKLNQILTVTSGLPEEASSYLDYAVIAHKV
jgi:2-polyprenyl-3-methyl-5-hydroxy-6-metoxy-1,4-benzoquinol methylase